MSSCLERRLEPLIELTPDERAALHHIERHEKDVARGHIIRREGDFVNEIYILIDGWAGSSVALRGVRRQILRLYFPGDLMGAQNIASPRASDTLTAITDVRLCPFSRTGFREFFTTQPRLAAIVFFFAQAEHTAQVDRIVSLGQMTAKERIAAFLLDIMHRAKAIDNELTPTFNLPLTQEELGAATGLTSVHVNRMLRSLVEEGSIERKGNQIRILHPTEFRNRYGDIDRRITPDLNWLPEIDTLKLHPAGGQKAMA